MYVVYNGHLICKVNTLRSYIIKIESKYIDIVHSAPKRFAKFAMQTRTFYYKKRKIGLPSLAQTDYRALYIMFEITHTGVRTMSTII